jgi:hypothetical protein
MAVLQVGGGEPLSFAGSVSLIGGIAQTGSQFRPILEKSSHLQPNEGELGAIRANCALNSLNSFPYSGKSGESDKLAPRRHQPAL